MAPRAGGPDLYDSGAMRPDRAATHRPLTRTERSLLDALLDADFDGAAELRVQVEHATASPGCQCGCGMIDLHVPEDVPASSHAGTRPVEGAVVDAAGDPIGSVLLFVEQGRLTGLEVHSLDEPLPFLASLRVRS